MKIIGLILLALAGVLLVVGIATIPEWFPRAVLPRLFGEEDRPR